MKPETSCHAGRLQMLIQERLTEADETKVLSHLDDCAACRKSLEALAADSQLWNALPEQLSERDGSHSATTEFSECGGPAEAVSLDVLKEYLHPTDDPTMLGRIGGYEVCGLIGQGSTGVVVKALEPRLNRFVAIKILSPAFAGNGSARRRFEREGQAVAAVSHEHVVPVFAVDEHRGIPFIVMQYIAGPSLHQRIERHGPLDSRQVVRIGLQVSRGLAAAHSQGVIHRDIKPSNVMLEDSVDRVLVTDFGLARVADEAAMTRSGMIAGTPQFMSPEQARGESIDHRSDLFSLGSTMYAACTGRPPFRAETVFGVIRRVCEQEATPIRDLQEDIPEWLAAFICKLMAKDRDHRFESAQQVADLLARELAHLQNPNAAAAPPRNWLPSMHSVAKPTFPTRSKSWFATTAAALFVGAVVLFAAGQQDGDGGAAAFNVQAPNSESGSEVRKVEGKPQLDVVANRTFPAAAGGRLNLTTDVGHVELKTSDAAEVSVTVTHRVATENEEEARQLAARHKISYSAADGNLTVDGKLERQEQPREGRSPLRGVSFVVAIPRNYSPTITTGGGHIALKDPVKGEVRLKSAGGHLRVADVDGGLWARTAGGHISAGAVQGSADVNTSGGNISLARVRDSLTAETAGGNITLKDIGGAVKASTSGGNVVASLTGQPNTDCDLSTSGGNVHVSLGRELALNIDASTQSGNLSAPFAANGRRKKNLNTKLNGGGPTLRVRTSGGNVSFQYRGQDDQAANRGNVGVESVSLASTQRPLDVVGSLKETRGPEGEPVFESVVERVADVGAGGKLKVRLLDGDIRLKGGSQRVEARIVTRLEGNLGTRDTARELLERRPFRFDAEDKLVTISETYPPLPASGVRRTYELSVPSEFEVELRTADGHVTVENMSGRAVVSSGKGDIALSEVEGESIVEASNGEVGLAKCSGTMIAASSAGNVRVLDCEGSISATTSDGKVIAEGWSGSLVTSEAGGANSRLQVLR